MPEPEDPPRAPKLGVRARSLSYRSRLGHGPSRSLPARGPAGTLSSRAAPRHLLGRAASSSAQPRRPSPRAVHAGTRARPGPTAPPAAGRSQRRPPVLAQGLGLQARKTDREALKGAGERERRTWGFSCKWGEGSLFTEPRTERGRGAGSSPKRTPGEGRIICEAIPGMKRGR